MDALALKRRLRAALGWLERATRDHTWRPPSPSAWDEDGNAHGVWEREGPPRAPWVWVVGFLALGALGIAWAAWLNGR